MCTQSKCTCRRRRRLHLYFFYEPNDDTIVVDIRICIDKEHIQTIFSVYLLLIEVFLSHEKSLDSSHTIQSNLFRKRFRLKPSRFISDC